MARDAQQAAKTAQTSDSMQHAFMEALRDRNGDGSAFLGLLAHASLTEEQQSMIQLLLSLGDDDDLEPAPSEGFQDQGDQQAEPALRTVELGGLLREVEDLRVVNDTLATALGACRLCWGGERGCDECTGRGVPGSRPPDVELFNALIAPAVRRARSISRASPAAHAGADGPALFVVDPRR